MSSFAPPRLPRSVSGLVDTLFEEDRRVLLWGETGAGKSTLAAELARELGRVGRGCLCICADPGSPAFGVPGAVCLGVWQHGGWVLVGYEALCSLDAARFRLPLILALHRLVYRLPAVSLLIDAPGVSRSVAGAELLLGIAAAAGVDAVLVLTRAGKPIPLQSELSSLDARIAVVPCAPEARRPPKQERARRRTALWDTYLVQAGVYRLRRDQLCIIGTLPPEGVPAGWEGRQCALLDGTGETLALGEVLGTHAGRLSLRLARGPEAGQTLLIRDARRGAEGLLETAGPGDRPAAPHALPPDMVPWGGEQVVAGPGPIAHLGSATAVLVNGVFGDPLLHLRLRLQKRSLLFDLGSPARLPARIAHQVSDVFISHAHIDHIGGFLWLLRSRIGELPVCRLFGPPGLAGHIQGLIQGIRWDRIGARGPRFEVVEFRDGQLTRFWLQAGRSGCLRLEDRPAADGVLLDEPSFTVRAVTLDHGIPVLAYAFESRREFSIRKERLRARGLAAGPWVGRLKRALAGDERGVLIRLPDGQAFTAGRLAGEMVLVRPGKKLVYATDLADTADNRTRLIGLGAGAHSLFCEAAFVEAHAGQAASTGHLTARACGEIACAAQVQRLLPFHFSRRYEKDPGQVYREVRAACPRTLVAGACRGRNLEETSRNGLTPPSLHR